MDEAKILYSIINDIWYLAKTYIAGKERLTDADYEKYVADITERAKQYRDHGELYINLYESLIWGGLDHYIKEKNRRNDNG